VAEIIVRGIVTGLAILAVCALEALAINKGIDGVYFGLALVAIAGLGGYELRDIVKVVKKRSRKVEDED